MPWPVERTATAAIGQPDGVLSDINFGEVFPFVAKPLARDFLARYIGPLLCSQFAGLSRDHPLVSALNPMAFVAGRPYMDLSAYVTIPALRLNLRSFESVDQTKGASIVALAQAGRLCPLPIRFAARLTLYRAYVQVSLRAVARLLGTRTPVALLRSYRMKADDMRRLLDEPVAEQSSAGLLRELDKRFQDERDATSDGLQHLSLAMVLHGALQRILAGRVTRSLLHDLGQGISNNLTTEVGLDLWDLAQNAKPVARLFLEASPEQLPARLQATEQGLTWWRSFEQFLVRHGHRGEIELDISSPRWREQPRFLLQTIANYLRHPETAPSAHALVAEGRRRRDIAAASVRKELPFGLRLLFDWLYTRYILWMPFREAGKYVGLLWLDYSRKVYRELGQRLVNEGQLQTMDDVFWLGLNELEAWATTGIVEWTPDLLRERKQRWHEWCALQPPPLLIGTEAVSVSPGPGDRAPVTVLHGTPASTGQAEGVARIMTNPEDAELLQGEILVTRYTDPAWTPLFFTATALITEVGGVLSHGAVVAREVGLPAIVGVANATTLIRSGQRLRVNATEGTVELL
jgi:phosphohistidine swiveling domain-containing protein